MASFQFLEKYAVDGVHYDSAKELTKMANSSSKSDIHYAATHPKTPHDQLEKLSNYDRDFIRSGVAKNPATPHHILDKLADDPDYEVRGYAAKNPSLSSETIDKMVSRKEKNMDDYIKSKLVDNPSLNATHVQKLMDYSIEGHDTSPHSQLFYSAATHPLADKEFIKSIPEKHPEFHGFMKAWHPHTYAAAIK